MESAETKDPEAAPLIEVNFQPDKSTDSSDKSPSHAVSEQLAKTVCCTFRVRVFAVIMLLLFQVPIFAYYYRTAYNLDFGNLSSHMNPRKIWNSYVRSDDDETKHSVLSTQFVLSTPIANTLLVTKSTKRTSELKVNIPTQDGNLVSANMTKSVVKAAAADAIDQLNDVGGDKTVDSVKKPTTLKSTTTVSTSTTTLSTTLATISTTPSSDSSLPVCPETPPKLVVIYSFNYSFMLLVFSSMI